MNVPKVHILATCRTAELIRGTTMVFDTLRTGFPTAHVTVWWNERSDPATKDVVLRAAKYDEWKSAGETIHHEWITRLLQEEESPFFILDTDVAFWENFERFNFSGSHLAGRQIPKFRDKFTNCITEPRLHTSLLYFDPGRLMEVLSNYWKQFPNTPFNPKPSLIDPTFFSCRRETATGPVVVNCFRDTCCQLYQAIGGTAFTPAQLDAYSHLNFGTLSDLVAPYYPEIPFRQQHFAVFDNPIILKGHWRQDDDFYRRYAVD